MAGDSMMAVVNAEIPEERWREFLNDQVVSEATEMYLRRRYPAHPHAVSAENGSVGVRMVTRRGELRAVVKNGLVAPAATAGGMSNGSEARAFVAEIAEMLDFIADIYVERIVQITLDRLDTVDNEAKVEHAPRPRVTIHHEGTTREAWAFTARLGSPGGMRISVIPLPRGHMQIWIEGQDVTREQATHAVALLIANLNENGLMVKLTAGIDLRSTETDDGDAGSMTDCDAEGDTGI